MEDNIKDKAEWGGIEEGHDYNVTSNSSFITHCYRCGVELSPGSEYCGSCGIQLYVECPNCKSRFLSKYSFCPQCGTNREDYFKEQKRIQELHEEERRKEIEREAIKIAAIELESKLKEEFNRLIRIKIRTLPEIENSLVLLNRVHEFYKEKCSKNRYVTISAALFIIASIIYISLTDVLDNYIDFAFLFISGLVFLFVSTLVLGAYSPRLNVADVRPKWTVFDFSLINKDLADVANFFYWGGPVDYFKWDQLESWLEESYIKYYNVSYENCPCEWLDAKPVFPTSIERDFYTWIQKNVNYPEEARANGIQGQVQVLFTVNREGNVENVRVQKSCYSLLDNELVRVISQSPQWIPGKFREIPVPVTYVHKHTFKI